MPTRAVGGVLVISRRSLVRQRMTFTVERTCTEILHGGGIESGSVGSGRSDALGDFRTVSAYVLLGDPGSGKTKEFERECEALGSDKAERVTARNFVRLDLDRHRKQWQDKTLFIDGLDEIRSMDSDVRASLDRIRKRLEQLGCPRFRISCREADWLGPNDSEHLKQVSPDSDITVLALDPLDEQAISELLTNRITAVSHNGRNAGQSMLSAAEFEGEARSRGLGFMLEHPQTLRFLVDAFCYDAEWPQSRQEVFEKACHLMAEEPNPEHQAAARQRSHPPMPAIVDAAGYLCVLHLLSDTDGYSLGASGPVNTSGCVALNNLGEPPGRMDDGQFRVALSTRLFTVTRVAGGGEDVFIPRHRHVAEFLAGRYLARRIESGLPARRIIALMTGPGDARVVTSLRGLSAWLAVHSDEAREQLIDVDPVGVGLYGDIKAFSTREKELILQSLVAFAGQAPRPAFPPHCQPCPAVPIPRIR